MSSFRKHAGYIVLVLVFLLLSFLITEGQASVRQEKTVEQCLPGNQDPFYSSEEPQEFASLIYPHLTAIKQNSALFVDTNGLQSEIAVGQTAVGWELVAVVTLAGQPAAVFERHFDHWGLIVYVPVSDRPLTLRKAIGKLNCLTRNECNYTDSIEKTIVGSQTDILGEKVLGIDTEPSFESCAALMPDIADYTFLSTENSGRIIAVEPDGILGLIDGKNKGDRPEQILFDPHQHLPPQNPTAVKRGLVGGWLPVIDYGYFDSRSKLGWEEIAFARTGLPREKLDIYVYLRIVKGDGTVEREYYRPTSGVEKIDAEQFFTNLLELKLHWSAAFSGAMSVRTPETRVSDASLASLARAFITYDNNSPRYGVGHYGREEHDTFPPTTLSMVNACLEWGLFSQARQYLDYYLDNALNQDGTFNYYGPAVSEYGKMLDTIARLARTTGDNAWLDARLPKIESLVQHLLTLRLESRKKFRRGELYYGLIMGSPEADTKEQVNYYFSGDMWAWRGCSEIARLLAKSDRSAVRLFGEELIAECDAYRVDIESSLHKSIIQSTQPPFVPPVAGFIAPFRTMTQDDFASYTNYRYWPEMLSSGFLSPRWQEAIIDYRTGHGGELLGTTRFRDRLDDWPYADYAYGLILHDRVAHYLLGYYGDMAIHRMQGTFSAYEQVTISSSEGQRKNVADYCVPAQLVTPLMTKWMLVFENPDSEDLWLCRATPRRWLSPGKGIEVRGAATRWGQVSFSVKAKNQDSLSAELELPQTNQPWTIYLRLRTPEAKPIHEVKIDGIYRPDCLSDGDCIRITNPDGKKLEVEVFY